MFEGFIHDFYLLILISFEKELGGYGKGKRQIALQMSIIKN